MHQEGPAMKERDLPRAEQRMTEHCCWCGDVLWTSTAHYRGRQYAEVSCSYLCPDCHLMERRMAAAMAGP